MESRPKSRNKAAFSANSSGLKSVEEMLLFRDRLVWTVGLTVEIHVKPHFQIPPVPECGPGLIRLQ